jgi:hypothetical protein
MTGSHEVRGSIPLGSTNTCNKLGHPLWMPYVVLTGCSAVQMIALARVATAATKSAELAGLATCIW